MARFEMVRPIRLVTSWAAEGTNVDFEDSFANWLTAALSNGLPSSVRALSFNLYEPAFEDGVTFGVELIGTDRFDEEDTDWACDEVWEPTERGLTIPSDYSGDTWEECLARMSALVERHISEATQNAVVLKSADGIGVGFVDGDLQIVWHGNR